jgi:hypothetical protein
MDVEKVYKSKTERFVLDNVHTIFAGFMGTLFGLVGRYGNGVAAYTPFIVGGCLFSGSEMGTMLSPVEKRTSLKRRVSNYASYALGVAVANADRIYYAASNLGDVL